MLAAAFFPIIILTSPFHLARKIIPLSVLLITLASVAAQEKLPVSEFSKLPVDDADWAILMLTPRELNFIFKDPNYMTRQERLNWNKQFQETPDLTNKLYELLWHYVANEGYVGPIFSALGRRSDLSPDQLKRITDRMRTLSAGSVATLQRDKRSFLYGGLGILVKYPSPEHEDLALMLLEKDDWTLKTMAAITLGKIGAEKSVEPVRRYVECRLYKSCGLFTLAG